MMKATNLVEYLCFALILMAHVGVGGLKNTAQILSSLGKHSDHRVRPLDGTGQAVMVNVSLVITDIRALSEEAMEFGMSMYVRHIWNDPRLQFTDGPEAVNVVPDVAERVMWIPDIHITNAKDIQLYHGIVPNKGYTVYENGNVRASVKMSVTSHCGMDLRNFPMDTQECHLYIEPYMYTGEHIELGWDAPPRLTAEANPPDFRLYQVSHHSAQVHYTSSTFERLTVSFKMRRLSTHYIVMTYIPSLLLVALSCLIFWLPITSLGERTFFGVFLLLAMVVILAASQYGTPQVGYLKALDVWVITCFIFLFVAVLEVVVLFLVARKQGSATRSDEFELMKDDEASRSVETDEASKNPLPRTNMVQPAGVRRLDLILRVLYPASFVLFNAIYWATLNH